ncbi:patatin-like phospholipase family protein [Colwellia sp. TT2012]|uniref:patatin-like phospholipase family protein n=1 Tax=Colwellia sp. TT2012 TaxID=1720342 RepID=UPI000709BF81|nr:patatin-like phospholipase family protein [Colwellia sp. TT2012]
MQEQKKLGLSLSGGGFRASFYHIGVLARMAELGQLKKVEVISTVSGGSVVGAAYYILLKTMLETHDDKDLTDQHYIDLVADLEHAFRLSVQKNIRWRTFANPWANIKMGSDKFSRSDQIGILYDKFIYNRLINRDKNQHDGGLFSSIKNFFSFWLVNPITNITQLKIYPKNSPDFHPHKDNSSRNAKVPILVLNATCLNSGHNWAFTASNMGEIPPLDPDVNKTDRYLKVKYTDIQKPREKGFPLGKAVASSAGVPGAFPPLSISNLYPEGRTIQLIDGGVFDNMGIAGLQNDPEIKITHFIVSDASGQGESSDNPANGTFSVVLGTTNLLMARVREKMIYGLKQQHEGRVAYFHLNRGMGSQAHAPIGAPEPVKDPDTTHEFDVEPEMQHALSKIRTDLDSFSDKEIYALELDGYLMSNKELTALGVDLGSTASGLNHDWAFQSVSLSKTSDDYQDLLTHVSVGQHKMWKLFNFGFLKSVQAFIVHLPTLAVFLGLITLLYTYVKVYLEIDIDEFLDNRSLIYLTLALLGFKAVELLAEKMIKGSAKTLRLVKFLTRIPLGIIRYLIVPILISLPILVYLATANKFFVYQGRVKKLD